MADCPIFRANEIAEKTWLSIEELIDVFKRKLEVRGFTCADYEASEDEDEKRTLFYHYAYQFPINRPGKGNRRRQGITLHFDVCRNITGTPNWPHAREAILVVAYSNLFDDAWDATALAINQNGFLDAWGLVDRTHYEELSLSQEDQRLIVWNETKEAESWSTRSWLFALPLRLLTSPNSLELEVIEPLTKLLLQNTSKGALTSNAITWPA